KLSFNPTIIFFWVKVPVDIYLFFTDIIDQYELRWFLQEKITYKQQLEDIGLAIEKFNSLVRES
ncbi:hypothetical protein, partial [Chryseobacterium sp. CH1]|uniref:hypothetical protein n=1 Tax=Chryseobacterium sp. CH1 TaxID=713551 RepID=UPI001627D4C1